MNKVHFRLLLLAFLISISFTSWSQIITTFAGTGIPGYSSDGIQATASELFLPYDAIVDSSGNIYIADSFNNRIRKVNTSGVISTIAGNGYGSPFSGGYSGDGGQATDAEVYYPNGVAIDAKGNIYISDFDNQRIRKINTSGIISTLAGNGTKSFSGDGGPAIAAEINGPTGVAVDDSGNVYIADYYNNRIRIVNTSGIINTFAGNGTGSFSGDGGPATDAELFQPSGMAQDPKGNIYIADYDNSRVRIVNTSGIISTFTGNGLRAFSGDGGPASAAEVNRPANIAFDDSGNVYIADYNNNRIRKVATTGIISTIAGTDSAGYSGDGGPAIAAELDKPTSVATDVSGNLYVADWYNNRVRKIGSKTSGTNKLGTKNEELRVYPNATNGSFTVTGVTQGQIIELYNSAGEKLQYNF